MLISWQKTHEDCQVVRVAIIFISNIQGKLAKILHNSANHAICNYAIWKPCYAIWKPTLMF